MNNNMKKFILKLNKLGINVSPESYNFIRYYPPLETLPRAKKISSLNLDQIKGSLALFVYIPFCASSCNYCFYIKKINPTEAQVDQFLDSLEKQADMYKKSIGNKQINSVYVGGGTPSILNLNQINRLIKIISNFNILKGASFTFEASPETIDQEKIDFLLQGRVTRISMGVQSLNDQVLKNANRKYTKELALEKIELLRKSRYSYNLDFIYGLKEQTADDINNVLQLIKKVQPPSITFYQKWFSMKDGLNKESDNHADNQFVNDVVAVKQLINQTMENLGYTNDGPFRFVKKPTDGCSYCQTVWKDNSCLALGPSAYSYINGLAIQNTKSIDEFQNLVNQGILPIERMQKLTKGQMATRTLILGLKIAGTGCGINIPAVEKKYKVKLNNSAATLINNLVKIAAIKKHDNTISFTEKGAFFAEFILLKLMEQECFG